MVDLLKDFPVVVETPVAWGDMDSFRHVNNVLFLRYMENPRVLYGHKIGIADRMESEGIGPILAWVECKYIKPITYPDMVIAGCRILSVEGSEMMMDYALVSREQRVVAAVGKSLNIYYNYRKRRRVDVPNSMFAKIEELEGKTVSRKHNK